MDTKEVRLDTKKMLKDLGKKGTKIKRGDRMPVEIVKATKHYKVGMQIKPHKVVAEFLISEGVAKAIK